ncbi:bifunctional folylpolyglutamate synthase/dihydrofolate synthase [Nitrospira sp.]|nr:bifunctional folylpolyglutamate synthase/dihydrofolate synthase [Nitrospira sp.]
MPGPSYADAVAYLFGLQRHGIKLGLESMGRLLQALGSPHEHLRTLHIGGTNGKGSTAAMVASILRAAGLRVGLYTSPHLVDFRERIRVNGLMIKEEDVADLTARLRRACPPDVPATFFEFTTAMALEYFNHTGVDVAVLEVGMGGRFDATNVVMPVVSCITTVAMDHEQYLGADLRAIAFEKAGIVKPGVPVVLGRLEAEARTVVMEAARGRGALLRELGVDFAVEGSLPSDCTYHRRGRSIRNLACPLRGRHQLDNLACAIAVIEEVVRCGLSVEESAIRQGLAEVQWPGRLEVMAERPLVLVDGAHNPAAAAAVAEYLASFRAQCPSSKVWLVLGMMQDKDHAGFVHAMMPHVDEVILTVPRVSRAASGETLSQWFPSDGPPARVIPAVSDAMFEARKRASPEDLICVTGSFMLIGEVKAILHGMSMSPLRG